MLGGTVFLSAAVVSEAVRRGHEVTSACRGASGTPPDGATFVAWDRADPIPGALTEGGYDAVVDVSRLPSHVRDAVAALPDAHWVFVSSVSVYADDATPGGGPDRTPLLEAITEDVDPASSPEAYGGMKVACEDSIRETAASSTIVRPGLVVGPGDPSGRFTYWPQRLARGGEVLAPGDPDDATQVIDVRDLAAWIVALAEERTTGTFDAVGPVQPLADVLGECAPSATLTWVGQDFLLDHDVEPWMGPDSVPLWLPRPEHDGMVTHDPEPARAAGLTTRPIAETARDTLAWLEGRVGTNYGEKSAESAQTPDPVVTGISAERERDLLAAWHERAR